MANMAKHKIENYKFNTEYNGWEPKDQLHKKIEALAAL